MHIFNAEDESFILIKKASAFQAFHHPPQTSKGKKLTVNNGVPLKKTTVLGQVKIPILWTLCMYTSNAWSAVDILSIHLELQQSQCASHR
jgi:hypothetical protein